jgi:uncharacterized protein YecE (DUF72 family)
MSGDQLDLGFSAGAGATPPPGSRVRFGTSSFAWDDWVGPFYPPGTKPADYLRVYATRFDCVEVDSTYYSTPAARTVDGWVAKTPAYFRLAAKFPRAIVHAGEAARPDPQRLLTPEGTYAERDRFLRVMERLGARLGPLVLQFPYFSKKCFASSEPFLGRLDRFLGDLPPAHRYAVEIRNPRWLGPPLTELCRQHRTALVLVDHEWMPHGEQVARELDFVTTDFCYVRLLGNRHKIEAITTTWEREVIDRSESLARWAALLQRLAAQKLLTWLFVNNHYAGHAPATVRALEALFRAGLAGDAGSRAGDAGSGAGDGGDPAGDARGRPGPVPPTSRPA